MVDSFSEESSDKIMVDAILLSVHVIFCLVVGTMYDVPILLNAEKGQPAL